MEMPRSRRKALGIALGLCLLLPCTVGATELLSPDDNSGTLSLTADRVIDDDCLAVGSDIDAQARVKGDLSAAGATVTIKGPVQGDLLVGGGTVLLRGAVGDDIRAVGGTVRLSGLVRDNVLLGGGNVTLERTARVGHDAVLVGGQVQVACPIKGNLHLTASEATVTGEIDGDFLADTNILHLGPGALVHGNLIVRSEQEPEIAPGAKVLGRIEHQAPAGTSSRSTTSPGGGSFVGWFMGWVFRFCTLMVLGSLSIVLAPHGTRKVEAALRTAPGRSMTLGFAAFLLIPLAVVALFATVIGIPAGVALMLVYGAILLQSAVTSACGLGAWLRQRLGRPERTILVQLVWGAASLSLVASLPWIGGFVTFLAILGGLGALVLERGHPLPHQKRNVG
jgi:hypothetical protein